MGTRNSKTGVTSRREVRESDMVKKLLEYIDMSSNLNETSAYGQRNSRERSQIQKRKYVRVPVEFTALIQQDRKLYSCVALNLSEDGLFLVVPALFSPSQMVDVTFRLPNSKRETRIPAKVAWCSKVKGRGKFIFGIGVQVTNDVAKETLQSFVNSVLQTAPEPEESFS